MLKLQSFAETGWSVSTCRHPCLAMNQSYSSKKAQKRVAQQDAITHVFRGQRHAGDTAPLHQPSGRLGSAGDIQNGTKII